MKKSKKTFAMNEDYAAEEQIGSILPDKEGEAQPQHDEIPVKTKFPDLSAQMDQVVQGLSGVQIGGQVYLVDVRQLEPYPEQPFHQYPLEKLQELAEDITRVGVLSPILTRQHKNKLQILAGHNRWSAAKLAGLSQVPVMILEADDDQAALILTSTNLRQRERLLPSEKAFAYKMQMEALKRQGQRTEDGYNASSFITQQTGDSRMQIHRYIRLTELDPGLLELLDKGKISLTPAVSVSYLKPEDQREMSRCVRELGARLTIEKGNRLKGLAEEAGGEALGQQRIMSLILGGEKETAAPKWVRIRYEKIRGFLPNEMNEDEIESWMIKKIEYCAEREHALRSELSRSHTED